MDPFLKVEVYSEGATKENLDDFLTKDGKLDLLIEECDSVDIKLLARVHARKHGIPVVMDTSDRGMIDIERFDLEPNRPLLHGLLDGLDLTVLENAVSTQEKLPIMTKLVGLETISERMKASLPELGKSILTWPQLASAVVLGGALVADITRRIMLGEPIHSQRTWVDLDQIFPAPDQRTPNSSNRISMSKELHKADSSIERITLHAYRAVEYPEASALFAEEHNKLLTEIGISQVTKASNRCSNFSANQSLLTTWAALNFSLNLFKRLRLHW